MEIYGERYFRPRGALLGVRAGRFGTPFGIYTRSDYGYSGFLRPPLIRYDGDHGVSNSRLEEGAMVTAGVPQLFVEASVSRPHDVGFAVRRDGMDVSVRVQGYKGQFVVGASHARSNPYLSPRFAVGRQAFSGVDVRWAHPAGFQARGELLQGHSDQGVSTIGWYIDGIVHRPGMGLFTALVRGEYLDYDASPPRARMAKRLTLATRVRLPGPLTLQVNYLRQKGRCRTSSPIQSTSARLTPSGSIASDELHHQTDTLARSQRGPGRRGHPHIGRTVARGRRVYRDARDDPQRR